MEKSFNICVVYDTKRGSTTHLANWVKEGFKESKTDLSTDVKRVHEVKKFDYDLFIIGSPIYWEKPLKTVVEFLLNNQDKLREKKVALFIVCMAQLFGKHTQKYIQRRYLKPLEEKTSGYIVKTGVFKGWLKKPDYNEKERVINWVKEIISSLETN